MLSKLFKFTSLLLVCFSTLANAEIKQQLGDWDVHYIAIPTSVLQPEIAREYGLKRSKYNAFVNISVLDKDTGKAIPQVWLEGTAKNLLGQIRELKFKKVVEQDAIYHIAQIPIDHEEVWRFNIDVNKANDSKKLKFQQKFYVD